MPVAKKIKKPRASSPPRLYAILARKSPMAVIFRRGPSKQTLLISWDTDRHEFRAGQWFKGRIYERRCDLSPSGEELIYFAASQKKPYYAWTAVSRPPFLTALVLWPKGDCWGGGGLFEDAKTILLNHGKFNFLPAEEFKLPKSMVQKPLGAHAGHGEDEPIFPTSLRRDGWVLKQQPTVKENKHGSKIWFEYPKNEIWTKTHGLFNLDMRVLGVKEREGPWYIIEHDITDENGKVILSLGRSDWADWSNSGEILFARQGCMFRIPVDPKRGLGKEEKLIDLTDLKFKEVAAPPVALKWSGRERFGEIIR